MKRSSTIFAVVAIAAGIVAIAAGAALGELKLVLGCVDAAWLFFAGASAGALAVTAAIRLAGGRWATGLTPMAEAAASFLPASIALLVALIASAPLFVAWVGAAPASGMVWLAARDFVPGVALALAARRLLRVVRDGGDTARPSIAYLFAFVVTMSCWAFDFAGRVGEAQPPTVLPVFFFVGSILAGLALAGIAATRAGSLDERARRDVGSLLFALGTFWAYLLWSIFLPAWYGNLMEENAPLLLRWSAPWRPASIAVLLGTGLLPFLLLLPEESKRSRTMMPLCAGLIAGGLLVEQFVIVLPDIAPSPARAALPLALLITTGMAGAFGLLWSRAVPRPR